MPSLLRISEAASLALHTMALLARQPQRRFTTREIAAQLRASGNHLAKVMQRLAKAELVISTRGPQGGFCLAKPAHQITLLAVYEAVDGRLDDSPCLLAEPLCESHKCILGDLVHRMHQEVRRYLADTRLASLAGGFVPLKVGSGRVAGRECQSPT